MLIQAAAPQDLSAVRTLLASRGLPTAGVADQFGDAYAVALDGTAVVGVAGVERYGRVGLLRSVAVAAAHQGRRLGEALVRNRVEWARAQGLARLYLLTTTAATYFPRLGFTAVAREQLPAELAGSSEVAAICPASAVAMVLHLEPMGRP